MKNSLLELRGLKKSFKGKQALRGIDLEIRDNEIFALLGPTGAGKTSTLHATAGLLELDQGDVFINNHNVTEIDPASRNLAVVFEGFNLLPVLSVYDNIAFALRSPAFRENEEEIRIRVHRTAELLKISQHLDRNIETLSGGEKQRVAIARALVRQPVMFLLDEPLSALDLKLREGLRAELRQIHREHKSSMFYATHDYHGAIAIADRIGIINNGTILQIGSINEIFACPVNAFVGSLIGSPAMAFFNAKIEKDYVSIDGCQQRLPAHSFKATLETGQSVRLGVWPEDIEIVDEGIPDVNKGRVYAVDNRGYEIAAQIELNNSSFRKVIDGHRTIKQGDNCGFRIAANAGFLFDSETGDRLSHVDGALT